MHSTDHKRKSKTDHNDEGKKPAPKPHIENPTDWTVETKYMLSRKEKQPTLTEEDERQLMKLDHILAHQECGLAGPTGNPGRNFFIHDIKYGKYGPEIKITSRCGHGLLEGRRIGLGNLNEEPLKPPTLAQLAEANMKVIAERGICKRRAGS